MPKPVPLSPGLVETPQATPQAATPARSPAANPAAAPKAEPMPLQVRWPREAVREVKVAAAQREQTVSDFMLACFHAYMKS